MTRRPQCVCAATCGCESKAERTAQPLGSVVPDFQVGLDSSLPGSRAHCTGPSSGAMTTRCGHKGLAGLALNSSVRTGAVNSPCECQLIPTPVRSRPTLFGSSASCNCENRGADSHRPLPVLSRALPVPLGTTGTSSGKVRPIATASTAPRLLHRVAKVSDAGSSTVIRPEAFGPKIDPADWCGRTTNQRTQESPRSGGVFAHELIRPGRLTACAFARRFGGDLRHVLSATPLRRSRVRLLGGEPPARFSPCSNVVGPVDEYQFVTYYIAAPTYYDVIGAPISVDDWDLLDFESALWSVLGNIHNLSGAPVDLRYGGYVFFDHPHSPEQRQNLVSHLPGECRGPTIIVEFRPQDAGSGTRAYTSSPSSQLENRQRFGFPLLKCGEHFVSELEVFIHYPLFGNPPAAEPEAAAVAVVLHEVFHCLGLDHVIDCESHRNAEVYDSVRETVSRAVLPLAVPDVLYLRSAFGLASSSLTSFGIVDGFAVGQLGPVALPADCVSPIVAAPAEHGVVLVFNATAPDGAMDSDLPRQLSSVLALDELDQLRDLRIRSYPFGLELSIAPPAVCTDGENVMIVGQTQRVSRDGNGFWQRFHKCAFRFAGSDEWLTHELVGNLSGHSPWSTAAYDVRTEAFAWVVSGTSLDIPTIFYGTSVDIAEHQFEQVANRAGSIVASRTRRLWGRPQLAFGNSADLAAPNGMLIYCEMSNHCRFWQFERLRTIRVPGRPGGRDRVVIAPWGELDTVNGMVGDAAPPVPIVGAPVSSDVGLVYVGDQMRDIEYVMAVFPRSVPPSVRRRQDDDPSVLRGQFAAGTAVEPIRFLVFSYSQRAWGPTAELPPLWIEEWANRHHYSPLGIVVTSAGDARSIRLFDGISGAL